VATTTDSPETGKASDPTRKNISIESKGELKRNIIFMPLHDGEERPPSHVEKEISIGFELWDR
jgi:hypothetical protein